MEDFHKLVDLLGIPVVTGMSSVDAMASDHSCYVGRTGGTGDRAGNFAVQNSDLLLSLGCRQGFDRTGFQYESWAKHAYTILNDIDREELKKPNLHVSLPVWGDCRELIQKLIAGAKLRGADENHPLFSKTQWMDCCSLWKEKYPVVTQKHYETMEKGCTNIYAFYQELSRAMKEDDCLVVSVGTARVAGSQAFQIKKGQRFITNPNTAAMGFCLPAAIGVSMAKGAGEVVCVTGEGSLQMNIQELQTIRHNHLPIKLFVINNQGYHSIRQTQKAYFGEPLVGVGEESGDLSFPQLKKLIPAYDLCYCKCSNTKKLPEVIKKVLSTRKTVVCEIFVTKYQNTEPKLASQKLENGEMLSQTLENMAPFLPEEELRENTRWC
jgi:acetolactate synthase-1/2/3 large subunit